MRRMTAWLILHEQNGFEMSQNILPALDNQLYSNRWFQEKFPRHQQDSSIDFIFSKLNGIEKNRNLNLSQ